MANNPKQAGSRVGLADVVRRAQSDPAFRRDLVAHPAAALQRAGVDVPKGTEVRVVENTDHLLHVVLPAKPPWVSDDDVRKTARIARKPNPSQPKLEALARLVLSTWLDHSLKARLLADPERVLAEHGITLPEGRKVRLLEADENLVHLVLPPEGGSHHGI